MSFICGRCKDLMCKDCRLIAEEYEQLLANYKWANGEGSYRVEQIERDLAAANQRAAMWEEQAKIGLPDVLKRWADTQVERRLNGLTPGKPFVPGAHCLVLHADTDPHAREAIRRYATSIFDEDSILSISLTEWVNQLEREAKKKEGRRKKKIDRGSTK